MSNRKLTKHQIWRAKQIQNERVKRATIADRDLASRYRSGQLSDEQTGLIICRYNKHFEVEALEGEDIGKIHHCVTRANINNVVPGDNVIWRADDKLTGVIESVLPRTNVLTRPDNFGKLKEVASNINQMLIVIACEPAPQPNLIDRYIVAAELLNIQATIVVNKSDLLNEQNEPNIESILSIYQNLGYRTVKIISSRHQEPELSNLHELINGKTSIVVGQSGVGKSSLINTLLPNVELPVGALSHATGEGTHTTTKATLFHLSSGGKLIDSPGIREFGLWHISLDELEIGFKEFATISSQCKFRDCKHENEPGCAILESVSSQRIHSDRFQSFIKIKESIRTQNAKGLKVNN